MASGRQGAHTARFEVTVGGTTWMAADGGVSDLLVETALDGADRFSMTLNEAFDPEHARFPGLTWGDLSTGTSVEIALGWEGVGSLQPLFSGSIHQLSAELSRERGPAIGVSGYGLLHDMMHGSTDRSWNDAKLGDVVDEVLSSYFGDRTVETGGLTRTKLYQHGESDYRFIRQLAGKYGYEFYAKRDAVYFTPRSSLGGGEPSTTLEYPGILESFSGEINEATEVATVEVRYWDMKQESEVVGTASTDAKNDKKAVFRIPCASKDEADTVAATKLERLSSTLATCHAEVVPGLPGITAGDTVAIQGVGERFAKNYYVTETSHRIGGSGYRTSFDAMEVPE